MALRKLMRFMPKKRKDKVLAAIAVKVEMGEEKLTAMEHICQAKEDELAAPGTSEEKLPAMSDLFQTIPKKLTDLTSQSEAKKEKLESLVWLAQQNMISLEAVMQLFQDKEQELAAMTLKFETGEEKLVAMSELLGTLKPTTPHTGKYPGGDGGGTEQQTIMEPETRDYFFKAQSTLTLFKTQDLHSSCCLQAVAQELQMALKDQPMAAGSLQKTFAEAVFQKVAVKRPPAFTSSSGFSTKQEVLRGKSSATSTPHNIQSRAAISSGLQLSKTKSTGGRKRPQWVKAFGNYCPNQWITDGQVNNYRCSQVQMASRRLWKNAAGRAGSRTGPRAGTHTAFRFLFDFLLVWGLPPGVTHG
ncbi:hypothetical protein COCON_G00174050 [Conger conger]|uniref:Uncharacterized protein n=1 Tax=Conger conger TaxID=82655 RepID=A0A9Q1D4F1_CONCO|nr:hypothetical protein COCON_G00174050 [Conger conger]